MERKHPPRQAGAGPRDAAKALPDSGVAAAATKSDDVATKTKKKDEVVEREREIDETLEESFPSSDPPSWTLGK